MNFTGLNAIEPILKQRPLSKITINLSLLETLLLECFSFQKFNQILSQMLSTGFIQDTYAASRVILFSTSSSFIHINYSHKIFDQIEHPNGFTWNTMMRGYVQRNQPQDAIFMYKSMLRRDGCVDKYTYPILVQACGLRLAELEGRELHSHVVKMGFENDVFVQNNLINMYSVCGSTGNARRVFDESSVLDSVSWNSILAGYVQIGNVEEAKKVYDHMPKRNVIASNSMILLLGKSGRVDEASQLFCEMEEKDYISWTALVSCYEQNGLHEEALKLFVQMCSTGITVDEIAMVTVLSACAHSTLFEMGKSSHGLIYKLGFEAYVNLQNALIHMYCSFRDLFAAQTLFDTSTFLDQISWNSMLSGYLECGEIDRARALFDAMPTKDVVAWSAMISGSVALNLFPETLSLFQDMLLQNVRPDDTTLVSVVSACSHLAALDQGKWLHAYMKKNGFTNNVILNTTTVDMYMKCGDVNNAIEVFNSMEEKAVSSWNAVIMGLAMNGHVERSLEMFEAMRRNQIIPNAITFVAILGACRHMGLVNEGRYFFDSMTLLYNIEPNVKHYGCMVDLLGRAGQLKEAESLIDSMPMEPDVTTWGALLGACKKHGAKEIGERVGRKLIQLQPDHDGFHVLLSNIYASKGEWSNVKEIRGVMMKQGVVKNPGCSMIETNGVVHEFLAGGSSHPQMEEIEVMLNEMTKKMKMPGHVASRDDIFFDINIINAEENFTFLSEMVIQ